MKIYLPFIIALLMAVVSLSHALSKKVTFKTVIGELTIETFYKAGMEKWAENINSVLKDYIPKALEYVRGNPFLMKSMKIYGVDADLFQGTDIGGEFNGVDLHLGYPNTPIDNPSLLIHEINHFLFPIPQGDEWCMEGLGSFLPVAMLQSGFLDPKKYSEKIFNLHWGLYHPLAENQKDLPVYPDFRFSSPTQFTLDAPFFYTKTYKIQYLIFKTLGPEKYRDFLCWLNQRKYALVNLEAIPEKLKQLKDIDWKHVLSGWVYKGEYHDVNINSFGDFDHDGLIDIDEIFGKSDPRLADTDGDFIPDGSEINLGSDPLKADDPDFMKKNAPYIDGSAGEWKYITSQKFQDKAGDGNKKAGYDFTELNYTLKDNNLYIIVQSQYPIIPKDNIVFDVLIDLDLNGAPDYEFAFMMPSPVANWIYRDGPKTMFIPTNTLSSWNNEKNEQGETISYFEMKLPMAEIGSPKKLKILPIVRDLTAGVNFDEWSVWIPVEVK